LEDDRVENEMSNNEYSLTSEDKNLAPPGKKTVEGTDAARSAVQKLKSFQFVKSNRKRNGEKLSGTVLGAPPSKIIVREIEFHSSKASSCDDDQLINKDLANAESCAPTRGFQVNYPTSGRKPGDWKGTLAGNVAEAMNDQFPTSSGVADLSTKLIQTNPQRDSTSPTSHLNSRQTESSHKAMPLLVSAKPSSRATTPSKRIMSPFSANKRFVTKVPVGGSNHTLCADFSENTNSTADPLPSPWKNGARQLACNVQTSTSHLVARSVNDSSAFQSPTNAAIPRKSPAIGGFSTPLPQTNAAASLIHSLRARPAIDPWRYSRPLPISTPSIPSSANLPAVTTPRSSSLPQQDGQGIKSTPLPSTPLNPAHLVRPAPSLTPRTSSAKFTTPTKNQGAVISSLRCSSKRPHPSTPTSALMCIPSSTPSYSGIDILRTPVPVPQRKFPGPAGLLPRLVKGFLVKLSLVECLIQILCIARVVQVFQIWWYQGSEYCVVR